MVRKMSEVKGVFARKHRPGELDWPEFLVRFIANCGAFFGYHDDSSSLAKRLAEARTLWLCRMTPFLQHMDPELVHSIMQRVATGGPFGFQEGLQTKRKPRTPRIQGRASEEQQVPGAQDEEMRREEGKQEERHEERPEEEDPLGQQEQYQDLLFGPFGDDDPFAFGGGTAYF
jgi:hypothetical protein